MKSVRMVLSAIGLVVTMLGMATVPAFAAMAHPTCAAKHHDCGKTASIAKCCCGDEQSSQSDSSPSQSRVEVRANFAALPISIDAPIFATAMRVSADVHTSPPHQYLVDLPTLFSSLLI